MCIFSHTKRMSVTSDQALSVVVVVVVGVNFFGFLTSSLEPLHGFASNFVWMFLGWTPTKFVKIRVLPLFFMELWVILCNFWPILKKSSINPEIVHIWFGESPGGLVSSLFKVGCCDLYLRFKLTIFVKHIFDFSQTATQILMKFSSHMHLSKVTQVCSNQGCMTYFY